MFRICRSELKEIHADVIAMPVCERPDMMADLYRSWGFLQLVEERRKKGVLSAGTVTEIPVCGLDTKHLYLMVLDHWQNGDGTERKLRTVMRNVFARAEEAEAKDLAILLPEVRTFGIPKNLLAGILRQETEAFTQDHDMDILLVNPSKEPILLAQNLHAQIFTWIDNELADLQPVLSAPMAAPDSCMHGGQLVQQECSMAPDASAFEPEKGFQEHLLDLIDESGEKDADVYHRANLDRRLFSRIRSEKDYHPKKDTAVSLALALHLDLDDAQDLLERAGYAFSPASRRDLILEYCFDHRIYDLFDVDALLCDLNERCL